MTVSIVYRLLLVMAASFSLLQVVGAELRDLKVQCSRNGMTVHVKFDTPFYGIIYSQDFYQVDKCTYVTSADSAAGRTSFSFSIPQKGCGTTTSPSAAAAAATSTTNRKSFNPFQRALDVRPHPIQQQVVPVSDDVSLENTIIVQHDPDFQEAGDMARRLRCFWRNSLQKSVNAKMPEVYQPSLITVKYDYRSVNQLVDVQLSRSSGPLAQPVKGFISSSPNSPSSLVIYLKDGTKAHDANVLSCSYFNARTGETVKLTDEEGCSLRPDLTTTFYKMRETTNPNSDLTLYTYFRGFRVPRDGHFGINCLVEVCNGRCGERCRLRFA